MTLLAKIVAQMGAVLSFKNPNLFIVVPPGCVGNFAFSDSCQPFVDAMNPPKSKVSISRNAFSIISELRLCPIVANVRVITAVPVNTAVSSNLLLQVMPDVAFIPKFSTILNIRLERLYRLSFEKKLEIFRILTRRFQRE